MDIINNSYGKNYIKLSDNIYKAIKDLKDFNYHNIYLKAYTDDELKRIEDMFNKLFIKYLDDLENNNINSTIYESYLNNMSNKYKENTNERIVIDYLAGMTDAYIEKQYKNLNS